MKLDVQTSFGDFSVVFLNSSDSPKRVICELFEKEYDDLHESFNEKKLISGYAQTEGGNILQRIIYWFAGSTKNERAISNTLTINGFDENQISEFKECYWSAVFGRVYGEVEDREN